MRVQQLFETNKRQQLLRLQHLLIDNFSDDWTFKLGSSDPIVVTCSKLPGEVASLDLTFGRVNGSNADEWRSDIHGYYADADVVPTGVFVDPRSIEDDELTKLDWNNSALIARNTNGVCLFDESNTGRPEALDKAVEFISNLS